MYYTSIMTPGLLATTLVSAATVPTTSQLHKRSCGEKADLVCFGVNGGIAQNVNVYDVAYAASYLRYIAEENAGTAGAFFTSLSSVIPSSSPFYPHPLSALAAR
jgi:hypothetical protein